MTGCGESLCECEYWVHVEWEVEPGSDQSGFDIEIWEPGEPNSEGGASEDWRAPYSIGLLYLRQKKDYEQAAYWFEQQLELYPDSAFRETALRHLASCYLGQLKDYVRAAEAYEEYIANYPDDVCVWSCYTGLSECYAKMGDREKALGVLQTAYEKADSDRLRGEFAGRIAGLKKGGVQ